MFRPHQKWKCQIRIEKNELQTTKEDRKSMLCAYANDKTLKNVSGISIQDEELSTNWGKDSESLKI